MTSIAVRVPASTSNLGAGFDCLGLALDLWLDVRLTDGTGPPSYSGTLAGLDPEQDIIARTLASAAALPGRRLEAHSEIPVGKGLGSSAAARVAGIALRQLLAGGLLDRDAVFAEAALSEGHPDNSGPAAYGGLFLAGPRPTRLALARELGIALAVPDATISTHAARARLPRDVAREVAIAQAARAAALVLGLTAGDPHLIGFGMEDQLAVPHRKDLIPGFDAAVAAGREAGAYGVTISGAGSALLAFTSPRSTAAVGEAMALALTRAGNPARPLTPKVSEEGLRRVS